MSESDTAKRADRPGGNRPIDGYYETGVPRLDQILGGGLPDGSLVLIVGLPGSGKTTLATQIATHVARSGKTALILTALSESTNKLIAHLRAFTFFDPNLIGGPVQFLSLQGVLGDGLQATSEAIIAEVRRIKADIVVLDGFRGMRSVDADPQSAREFLYTIGTTLSALGATTLVTSESDPRDPQFYPEATTADVIIGLYYQLKGVRQFRGVEVIKARAAAPLPGLHALTLGNDGANIYPQLEERVAADILGGDAQTQGAAAKTERGPSPSPRRRVGFGLPQLDKMLHGGLPESSCTLVMGNLGTGKTLLALYYALAGIRAGERVVFLGFRESLGQLIQTAEAFEIGPELTRALQPDGGLTFLETPPIKLNADILADRVLAELDATGAQRLVIDSVAEIEQAILRGLDPGRLEGYLAALLSALRSRQVTALLIRETDKALTSSLDLPADALSILAENALLLQHVQFEGKLQRILSILKLRFSSHDPSPREFNISAPTGLHVLEPSANTSDALSDIIDTQEAWGAHSPRRLRRPRSVAEESNDE